MIESLVVPSLAVATETDQAVAVVIRHPETGAYLMVQEAKPHVAGLWNNAGGHREPGESLPQTGVREAKEEAGVDVRLLSQEPVHQTTLPSGLAYTAFLGEVVGNAIPQPRAGEILAVSWLPLTVIEGLHRAGKLRDRTTFDSIQGAEDAHPWH